MLPDLVLFLAVVSVGLMAGLFFSFSVVVMVTLSRVDDATFVKVMRRLNRDIQNVPYAAAFLGGFFFTLWAVQQSWTQPRVTPALLALTFYAAALAVTGLISIPLNRALDVPASDASLRRSFEERWVHSHNLRTALTVLAFGSLVWAALT